MEMRSGQLVSVVCSFRAFFFAICFHQQKSCECLHVLCASCDHANTRRGVLTFFFKKQLLLFVSAPAFGRGTFARMVLSHPLHVPALLQPICSEAVGSFFRDHPCVW